MERIEKLQYITSNSSKEEIIAEIRDVVRGGCKWVQLRMKNATSAEMLEAAKEVQTICKMGGAQLIINDNVEICREVDADGVHLGKNDISTIEARKILGAAKIIGRTCNTADDLMLYEMQEIDYIGLGPLRFTSTKKLLSPVIGLEGYRELISSMKTQIPVVAVGGIVEDDIAAILEQGVYGVALSGIIAKAENRAETTQKFMKILK